jgi:hypothetical protein
MKTGGERGTKYVARIGKIMVAPNGAMDTSSPQCAMLLSRHHSGVKRVFRSIHYGFSAVDYAGFVGRSSIPLAQGVLALLNNAFHVVGHGSHLSVCMFGFEMMQPKHASVLRRRSY